MARAGLSPEIIVEEAARFVDEVGSDQLTLAQLAKRFSVAQPSLYKHVDGLEGLQRLLAIKVARELATTLRHASTGKAGADALRAIGLAYRDFAARHPGRYAYVLRAPDPDDRELVAAAEETLTVLYAVLDGYGINGSDTVDAARFVRSMLHGFVSLELGDGFRMPRSTDDSFERMLTATSDALANWERTGPTLDDEDEPATAGL